MEKTLLLTSQQSRKMPNSPYLLLQEIYREHPWRMLVCCIMLNCTSRKQVDQVREKFFRLYPDPVEAERADPAEMAEVIALLGFKNKRVKTIQRFSSDWMNLDWTEPGELYGIGKYGQDSWEIFQKRNLNVEPTDGVLKKYLEWAKTHKSI
jgi:methyl-CpG-binding domain protein 4